MQVKIAARHGHLTEEHQTELSAKAEKLLHFFDRIIMIEVTCDLAGANKKVEIIAEAEHKHEFVAHTEAPDLMVAMNLAVDKVKHQIKHYKEKIQDHRRDPGDNGSK